MSTSLSKTLNASINKHPDWMAVELGETKDNYSTITRLQRQCSGLLKDMMIDRNAVGVMCNDSLSAWRSIMVLLSSGIGYVPIEPDHPINLNLKKMEQSSINYIITDRDRAISKDWRTVQCVEFDGRELLFYRREKQKPRGEGAYAYIMFTSGTTGTPKGVGVTWRNLYSYVRNQLSLEIFREGDRFSQTFGITFDLSVHNIVMSVAVGGTLCIMNEKNKYNIMNYIQETRPDIWFSVPSIVKYVKPSRTEESKHHSPRVSLFCGEPLYWHDVIYWRKRFPETKVINYYGPTEATISISHRVVDEKELHESDKGGIVPLGRIFPKNKYLILSDGKSSEGELLLRGEQIVSSYLDGDRGAFLTIGKEKWYRTGDIVREDDGELLYVGRDDQQVKINGHRVELLHLEAIINMKYREANCVVVKVESRMGDKLIVVEEGEGVITMRGIIEAMKDSVPLYMIPKGIIHIKRLPRTTSGKIDRTLVTKLIEKEEKYD